MTTPQLPNYLLMNRKSLDLSQEDVAYLLGAESGEKVSRHERFHREPGLSAALAYEVIYKKPVSELFDGLYREVEQNVAARAKSRAEKTGGRKVTRRNNRRRQVLSNLASLKRD